MNDYGKSSRERISIGKWLLAIMFLFLPVINIIPGIICLCGKKKTMRNFVVAVIIWWAIFVVLLVGSFCLFRFIPALHNLYANTFLKLFDMLGLLDKLPEFFWNF